MTSMSSRWMLALGLLGSVAACSSTTVGTGQPSSSSSSSSSSSGSTPLNADECQRRCTQKALSCSVPSGEVDGVCSRVCDGSYTPAQITCMESKSCAQLEAASSLAALCPATSSTSSSSGATDNPDIGKSCGDSFECSGLAHCMCQDGFTPSAPLDCIGSKCVPDCSFACQSHGGV